ncbi:hypothetical protein BEN74_04645 [Acinetobacter sp. WCHAc010034]|uniref:tape measure protein n=1 Tax=Acinetobacter sp. WCHAc010034 TaxID=1879049 RepID=UPI00083B1686|nr:tape measure protein [Acinetobacter sp. WCHAc010034]AYA02229.1 hypothetical protein BEN74_04645 [Acinetobacter sp. WCHAc010034]
MAGDLKFKLVLNGDTSNLTQSLQRSSDAAKEMFDRIKQESDRLRQSMQIGREVGDLVQQFHNATAELNRVSDASQLSADNLRQMGEYGQQAVSRLQADLQTARLELNRLSATNATPQDIDRARQRVQELEAGVRQTTIAVEAYQDAAREAMDTPPIPSQFQREVGDLVNRLDQVRQGLDENGRSAAYSGEQLQRMSREATAQLQIYENSLEQARLELNRLSATNATPEDIERARQRVQELERGVQQVESALEGYQRQANISNDAAASGADRASRAVDGVGNAWNKVAGIAAAFGIGLGAAELAQVADTFQGIAAQLRLVSDGSEEFSTALEGVRQVATNTTTSLEATANLYARISQAGKDLGVTQQQALLVTETINKSIQISGGSAASADAAITQLIQALQSGVLRGEEFNSMMEQAPRLTTALADSLNVTKGELRAMAMDGKLTSEIVINALKEQSAVIAEEYTNIPTTISGAFTNLKSNFTMLVGEVDSANAASKGIVDTLLYLSENLDVLVTLFNDATQAFAYFSDKLASTDASTIDAVRNAVISAYDAVKVLISALADADGAIADVFLTGLDVLFSWSNAVSGDATESVNGLAVVINIVSVAIGAMADGVSTISIGFKGLVGLMYDLSAAATYYAKAFTWGDLRAKLDADHAVLTQQRDKYYAEAEKDLLNFESKTQKALDESTLNDEQANQKKIASNKEKLAKILEDEAAASSSINESSKRRTELDAQLAKARAENNSVAIRQAIDGIKALDDAESEASQLRIKRDKEKLEAGEALAKASMASNNGVLTALAKEELLRQGIVATINSQGQLEVSVYQDIQKLNAERLVKIQELSNQEQKSSSDRATSSKLVNSEIINNDSFLASERIRLIKEVEIARSGSDLTAFANAKAALDNLGKEDAAAGQSRISNHQQVSDTVSAVDTADLEKRKQISDELVRLHAEANKAKQAGDFELYSKLMLQIDEIGVAQASQNSQRVSGSAGAVNAIALNEQALLEKNKEINQQKIKLAQQIIDSTKGIITAEQQAQFEAQGLAIEYDKAGKAIVKTAAGIEEKVRGAAKALDLDFDVLANRISENFSAAGKSVDTFSGGLDELGITGAKAADMTYQAWVKWLETAKSQAEIDLATARLQEFGKTGQLSAKQVELGMQAVRQVIQKLPADLDPVEQAFERLGIKTKEQLALAAQSALADFNTIQSSGKATAEGLRAAYERTMQAAAASGDAAIIASTQAKAASLGLQVQIDETGKASVQSMDEWTEANHRVRDSAGGIIDGYRAAGAVAREEAQSASEAWQAAVDKSNQEFRNELKKQQSMLSSLSDYESYSRGDVIKQIESMGYDSAEAKRLAGSIWSQGLAADRDAKYSGMGGFGPMDLIIDQEFDRAAAKGLTTQNGTNKINDLLRQLAGGSMVARTSAPTVSTPSAPRTVQNNISINGKTISIPVTEDRQGDFDDFLSELEKLKKAM